MGNCSATVKQADLKRYVAAVIQAGIAVAKITITPEGAVIIVPAGMSDDDCENPCDRLLER